MKLRIQNVLTNLHRIVGTELTGNLNSSVAHFAEHRLFLGVDAHGLVKDQGFPGVLRNIAEIDPGKVDAGLDTKA